MSVKQVAIIGAGVSTIAGGAGSIYYFTQDNTIATKLAKRNVKLISKEANDDVWSIALTENRVEVSFASKGEDLKKWCLEAYKESQNQEEKLKKVEKLCAMPPTTIEEKLTKDKKEFVSDWAKKFEEVKNRDKLIDKLQEVDKDLSQLDDVQKTHDALKNWCIKHKEDKLVPASYSEKYEELVDLCV